MADLIFADSHNMVAYLEKSEDNADFAEIVDFLNASPIRYALTVSPTVYVSYIEQFWSTAKIKTVNNETQIRAKVDGKTIVITESSVRRDLYFNDEDGITCLTNTKIFENLQLMGYEKLSDKLTFYKSFFSPQWKYLIHTILQCLSSKSTAWNEFGTNIASAVICLAKKQKFNFSKLIFDGMLRNLDPNSKKFLMYPRFLQLFLNNQIENLTAVFNDEYDTPSHTKKVFANMRRQGKYFSGTVAPLFATMLIQSQALEGEGSGQPTEPQHTPTTASPSHVELIHISSGPTTLVADETVHEERGDSVERAATTATSLDAEQGSGNINKTQSTAIPNDPFPQGIGSGGSPRCQDTMGDRPAQTRVLDLENVKDAQALEIKKLKKRFKKLESKKKSRTPQLKRRLFKVMIESSTEKSLGDPDDASKQRRNEIDQNEGISWFQEDLETQGRYGHDIGVNTSCTSITTASINITIVEPVTTVSAPVTTTSESIKSEKSKAKRVTMQEPSESGTRVRVPPPQIDPKDKGKAKMVEPEKPNKKKDQIEYDAEGQGEISIEERSKLFVELINERKKHFARLRAEEQRRKSPTKTQNRNLMSTYLKNMAGYKHTQLKNKSFKEIQMLFEKEMKRVNIFVDMDAELVKGSETIKSKVDRAVPKLAARISKRDAEELDQESSKRQKTYESSELAEEPRVKEADELS
ncbi:hypothetical protein Tco_1097688 [Tanacetum coccineum]